jgi:hypothetical protein
MKRLVICLAVLLGLTGCAAETQATPTPLPIETVAWVPPSDNPYAPQANDTQLLQAGLQISTLSLLAPVDDPQIYLLLTGALPSPCNSLRVRIQPPDAQQRVMVDVYSVVNPDLACTAVLKQFEAQVPLGVYPPGLFSVWINGQRIGDFNSAAR